MPLPNVFRISVPSLAVAAVLCLQARVSAQVQFLSDLEDADPACFSSRPDAGCNGWLGIHDAAISMSRGEKSHTGKQALKIVFAKNEVYGGTWRKADSRHIFTRFYDYYDDGFDFAAGMKIHRMSAFNEGKQINDFDIILQTKADDPSSNYCGLTDAKYLALSYNGGPVDWGSVEARWTPERKRWYCIETEIKLNTPGLSDGAVRIWVDGRVVAEKTGMNLTGSVASSINRVMFGGWYSNSAAGKNPCPDPVSASRRYVDDPAVSGSYIGGIPTVTAGPTPNSRTFSYVLPNPGNFLVEYGRDASYGTVTPAIPSANGVHSMVVTGLDTNRVYHYRVKSLWNTGYAFVSPDFTFSTGAADSLIAPSPRKPRNPPRNLQAHQYNPIPD
ncbi:MAG: hypothetical protein JWO30_1047 [Fibrobacteres bacterium]|nr:hypothetical protein [Fibrobacterota bacterium]